MTIEKLLQRADEWDVYVQHIPTYNLIRDLAAALRAEQRLADARGTREEIVRERAEQAEALLREAKPMLLNYQLVAMVPRYKRIIADILTRIDVLLGE